MPIFLATARTTLSADTVKTQPVLLVPERLFHYSLTRIFDRRAAGPSASNGQHLPYEIFAAHEEHPGHRLTDL